MNKSHFFECCLVSRICSWIRQCNQSGPASLDVLVGWFCLFMRQCTLSSPTSLALASSWQTAEPAWVAFPLRREQTRVQDRGQFSGAQTYPRLPHPSCSSYCREKIHPSSRVRSGHVCPVMTVTRVVERNKIGGLELKFQVFCLRMKTSSCRKRYSTCSMCHQTAAEQRPSTMKSKTTRLLPTGGKSCTAATVDMRLEASPCALTFLCGV